MVCPFCGAPAEARCSGCGRDPSAPRRVCEACRKLSPTAEPRCCHCKQAMGSEMAWKVPLIVLLFVAATILAVALQTIR